MLEDNQMDVLRFLAKVPDRSNKEVARAFFQEPYVLNMRIIAAYKLSDVNE